MTPSTNTPFTAAEIQGWKEENKGKRAFISNEGPNRRSRRLEMKAEQKAISNNRSNPKKRRSVYLKMSAFYLSVQAKIHGTDKAI